MSSDKSKRLTGKDLMTVGIFTAILLVISIACACTIGVFPLGFLLISVVVPLIMGIPMMLYITKIKKFGMLLITIVISGLILLLTGMGPAALITGVVIGLGCEFILKWGNYQSAFKSILAYVLYGLISISNYFHWFNASDEWLASQAATYGTEYVEIISANLCGTWWVFPAIIVGTIVTGFIGGYLGKVVLKKHFAKSGLI